MNWYLKCLKQYADFNGRARRMEFWVFCLVNVVIGVVLNFVYVPLYMIYAAAVLLPNIAVSVRRMHDINKSGWWVLISLIPIVGGIWFLVLSLMESKPGSNVYGPNPKEMNQE